MSASTTRRATLGRVRAILPTPAIGGLGVLDDAAKAVGIALAPWLDIVLVGATKGWLGQSLWLREIAGREEGAPPPVDLAAERANGDFVRAQILAGTVRACHDVSDGGLLVAVAEMAMAGVTGVRLVDRPARDPRPRLLVRRGPGPLCARRSRRRRADPCRRGGRAAGGADRHIRRTGFDTARWGHNIRAGVARGARTLLPVLDGRQLDPGEGPRMAMAANEIEALIKAAIPDARVTVEDLAGDGDHYAATVVSRAVPWLSRA